MFWAGTAKSLAAARNSSQFAGAVELEDRISRRGRLQGGPLQRDGVAVATLPGIVGVVGRRVGPDGAELLGHVTEQRTVRRLADLQHEVVAAAHLDRLGAQLERLGLAVLDPVGALDLLEIEVGDVGAEVGEAPRDVGVVADDHAGNAGEGEAGDVEGAVGRDLATVQPGLHPDAGLADPEVRVVGEQRHAGRAVLAVDDPRVGADAVAATQQLRDAGPARPAGRSGPRTVSSLYAGRRGLRVELRVAFCSKTPSTTPPVLTIGGCPSMS